MDKDLVADIKARLSVEDVVGSYLDLKRSGSSYKALSPFKTEKTPSLIVTPAKEIWKDFSSGKGGSLFNFVMEYEGVDFKQALEILARKAGLDPADYGQFRAGRKRYADLKKSILGTLDLATVFYQEQLRGSKPVQAYLNQRGFKPEIAKQFGLGYAPKSWQALTDHFKEEKVAAKHAEMAGLIKRRPVPAWLAHKEGTEAKERYGDFFADRLMIPLSDPQGATIGFTARLLDDKSNQAKYINSKQTIVYNKSKHVFGYFQAKEAIRQAGFALVVEGNLDVIACHQAGYRQTVAAGGTALTIDHLKVISRLTDDVRLAFDGDAAGVSAMERSLAAAGQARINLSIISLPAGLDPDDLIKQNLELWKKLVGQAQAAPDWLYHKYKSQLDLKTANGKKRLTDVMLPIINCLADEVEKDHYLKKLEADGISRSSLDRKLKEVSQQDIKPDSRLAASQPLEHTESAVEDLGSVAYDIESRVNLLLGLLLVEPRLRQQPADIAGRLENILKAYPKQREVYVFLQGSADKIEDPQGLPAGLQKSKQCVRMALDAVKSPVLGRSYLDDVLTAKELTFKELFSQFDNLQRKKERQA